MPLASSETFHSTLTEACKTTNPASIWFWMGNLFDVSHTHERSKPIKYAHVGLRRNVCVCTYVCIYIYVCVCIYIYTHIYTHTHTHTHIVKPSVADGYGTVGRSAAATSIQFHGKKTQDNINCYVFFIDQRPFIRSFPTNRTAEQKFAKQCHKHFL